MLGIQEQRRSCRGWLAIAAVAFALGAATPGHAQVVVVANGSPITELDIAQRSKLIATSTRKSTTRQAVINELIDERLKISKAKSYGMEIGSAEIDNAFETMAQRQGLSAAQFSQMLERTGVSPNTVKARIRAELTWTQLVRGRYSSTLQVGDSDIALAMRSRNETDKAPPGFLYTLYPVVLVVPRGPNQAALTGKLREAENLRSRFVSCETGLPLARALRDVAVRAPINRSSADLAPQLAELLGKMEVGRLTAPEVTAQGLQMFALCGKKESATDSAVKREVREELFVKRFETESKKFLDEIRKSAMIEYKR